MTLKELFEQALVRAGIARTDPGAFDISCLMEDICGAGRYDLPLRGAQEIPDAQASHFFELLARWKTGEPLQYLLGKWEFYGLPFYVGPGVLIPRQDTETLAEAAIAFLRGLRAPAAADLCAGSGCLSGAIARHTGARIYALELSGEALPYLKKNMDALAVPAVILHCDVLSPPPLPPLDLVVSNPPYIPRLEMETLPANVRREPEMALYGGEDGLDFYRRLPRLYRPMLKQGGAMMLETGYNQARTVAGILRDTGYRDISVLRDAAGVERVVTGIA